jgi:hypothetical protein
MYLFLQKYWPRRRRGMGTRHGRPDLSKVTEEHGCLALPRLINYSTLILCAGSGERDYNSGSLI